MAAINQRDKYLHQRKLNHQGYEMEIVEYNTAKDILVEFKEPYHCFVRSKASTFVNGGIRNPYAPTICGIGIIGNKYSSVLEDDGKKHTLEYQTWINMLKRCYDEKSRDRNKSYKDVSVCNEWKYFENFYEWYISQENYEILISTSKPNLDKDILCKGNKIYSPDKCTLVPKRINNLLLKSNSIRGKYPIGVIQHNSKFVATCGGRESCHYLGIYETVEEAFNVYKLFKEEKIKQVAKEEFDKGTITKQCYEALMNYQVEITD